MQTCHHLTPDVGTARSSTCLGEMNSAPSRTVTYINAEDCHVTDVMSKVAFHTPLGMELHWNCKFVRSKESGSSAALLKPMAVT